MTIRVKICGINSVAAIDAAIAARVDWLGFNFFPASPRFVTPAQAVALYTRHVDGARKVALLVSPDDAAVAAVVASLRPNVIQLHDVSASRAAAIRALFGVPVWHAVGIGSSADLPAKAEGFDGLLLDAKPPPDATLPGGNAVAFDWSVLKGWRAPAPWLLAGGLTPENVGAAIHATGAAAVDVSSGVESARGVKDPNRIAAFAAAARADAYMTAARGDSA